MKKWIHAAPVSLLALSITAGVLHAGLPSVEYSSRPLFGDILGIDAGTLANEPTGRFFTVRSYESSEPDAVSHIWGVDTQTGAVHELGLFGDGIHLQNSGAIFSNGNVAASSSGWVVGVAFRSDGFVDGTMVDTPSLSAWVSNVSTGVTHQIGLYDAAHELPNSQDGATGPAYINLALVATNSGKVAGLSINATHLEASLAYDFNQSDNGYGIFDPFQGQSFWVADANTGVTTRFGLVDAAHTLQPFTDGEGNEFLGGFQSSGLVLSLTESGYLGGYSLNFGMFEGEVHAGNSAWVGNTNNGQTYQVGLLDAQHTSPAGTTVSTFHPLFTGDEDEFGGVPFGTGPAVTNDGYVAGNSVNYTINGDEGQSAWVAGYDSVNDKYVTTRIGFFGDVEGGIFQTADGLEYSEVTIFTQSGLVAGYSGMTSLPGFGGAGWVVDVHTMVRTEMGLLGPEYRKSDGYRANYVNYLTNSGVAAGLSEGYVDDAQVGYYAWVQKVASSVDGSVFAAQSIGLAIEADSTNWGSSAYGLTQSGIVYGSTQQTLASGGYATDAWIAYQDGATYTTDRVGLTGGEFTNPDNGDRSSQVEVVKGSGVAAGSSSRYYQRESDGPGAAYRGDTVMWIASRAPGQSYVSTRVGIDDVRHTSPNGYHSAWFATNAAGNEMLTNSGYLAGYSANYGSGNNQGQTGWVVSAANPITVRVGLDDVRHTSANLTNYTEIEGLTESGYAWGYSERYEDGGSNVIGQTAWLYSFTAGEQVTFNFSETLSGVSYSKILGVGEDGFAYGLYAQYGDSEVFEGYKVFGWSPVSGAFVVENLLMAGPGDYNGMSLVRDANGAFVGITEDGQVFTTASAVPEPSTYAMIAGAVILGVVIVRRRRSGRNQNGQRAVSC